jgi:predicted dehydrogenase
VGVIGCGRIGLVHMKAIQSVPGCAVTMCSNPTLAKAEAAAAAFGVPVATADARDVLTSADVDAVWICSPSQYHAEQIVLAAENGKHVFCEKPISNNLEEAVEAVLACRERGVKLMIGLQRRFDPNFRRVKEAVDKRQVRDQADRRRAYTRPHSVLPSNPRSLASLGRQVGEELVQIKLCSRDPGAPPKSYVEGGGGLFVDMAVHDLDMSRFLAGAEPLAVLAVGSTKIDASIADLPGSEKFDTASIMVKYPKGVVATIDVCRQSSYGCKFRPNP